MDNTTSKTLVYLNPDDDGEPKPENWKTSDSEIVEFKQFGTWFGSIDGERDKKRLFIIERTEDKPEKPKLYLHDDGLYLLPIDPASDPEETPTAESKQLGRKIVPIELE